jgi:hypothetical protein
MDFIVGLSKLGNKLVIMVVVHLLSKYAHFYCIQHMFLPEREPLRGVCGSYLR